MENLTGKWDVVVHTYIGDQFAYHELTADGDKLTGTVMIKEMFTAEICEER
jgi:hypothetical protein